MILRLLVRAADQAAKAHVGARRGFSGFFGAGFVAGGAAPRQPCQTQDSDTFAKFKEAVLDGYRFPKLREVVTQDGDTLERVAALVGYNVETLVKLKDLISRLREAKLEDVDIDELLSALESLAPEQSLEHIERLRVAQNLWEEMELVRDVLQDHFGHIDLAEIDPLALPYRLLQQHRLRTPAWKAEHHRAHRGNLDISLAEDVELFSGLVEHCELAEAVYKRTEEEVRQDLAAIWGDEHWELPVCVSWAAPGKPAHLIAVRPARAESPDQGPRVVFAIRGTKELADVLTDASMDSSPFEGGRAHSGVVRAATDLCDAYGDLLREYEESGHDVVVVGHSLGAATAAAATVRLRQSCGLKSARCVCFAPPATLDATTARESAKYITSVVHDDDLIPRSQVRSLLLLHEELKAFDYRPVAKADIRERLAAVPDVLKALLPHDEITKKIDDALDCRMAERGELSDGAAEAKGPLSSVHLLRVPGFILHLYRSDVSPGYGAARVGPEHLERLELSETMVSDHALTAHLKALQVLEAAAKQRAAEEVERAQALLPLGTEVGKKAVAVGVQLSQKAKHTIVAKLESRPDTS